MSHGAVVELRALATEVTGVSEDTAAINVTPTTSHGVVVLVTPEAVPFTAAIDVPTLLTPGIVNWHAVAFLFHQPGSFQLCSQEEKKDTDGCSEKPVEHD